MDDCVDAIEDMIRDVAHVAEVLLIERALRQDQRAGCGQGKEGAVVSDQAGVGVRAPQVARDDRTHIAEVAGDQDFHWLLAP